ncbi:MgtC/SapB family protein [Candidatus Kaiserbacteria bacterium]|nr:MgtC/SapB family protein [Candidatus Kaiserbacteria bacterium]USN91901.1 MAG: MgtC/SapB family protein [Candidatus Nomurabacteria bacterium]
MEEVEVLLELWEYFLPVLVAALAGGLIGIEREYRDKSAGFRTMILIAVGSALFTILSTTIAGPKGEMTRIAAGVVSGVGFLGAGAILKDGITIKGLTTAASIWLVASLGMGAGAGEFALVGAVTLLILIVLWALPPFERWLDRLHEFIEIHITIKNSDEDEDEILDIFDECKIKVVQITRSRVVKGERIVHIKAKMTPQKRTTLSEILVNEKVVLAFES